MARSTERLDPVRRWRRPALWRLLAVAALLATAALLTWSGSADSCAA